MSLELDGEDLQCRAKGWQFFLQAVRDQRVLRPLQRLRGDKLEGGKGTWWEAPGSIQEREK